MYGGQGPHIFVAIARMQTVYRAPTTQIGAAPEIGNSPRSDINPALAAGLHAVFIPHPHTWHLEHEEVTPIDDGRLLTLSRFAELRTHF